MSNNLGSVGVGVGRVGLKFAGWAGRVGVGSGSGYDELPPAAAPAVYAY